MSLDQFIPGFEERCTKCGKEIQGPKRYLGKKEETKKPVCRNCFRKQLGVKEEEGAGLKKVKCKKCGFTNDTSNMRYSRKYGGWICKDIKQCLDALVGRNTACGFK